MARADARSFDKVHLVVGHLGQWSFSFYRDKVREGSWEDLRNQVKVSPDPGTLRARASALLMPDSAVPQGLPCLWRGGPNRARASGVMSHLLGRVAATLPPEEAPSASVPDQGWASWSEPGKKAQLAIDNGVLNLLW